MVKYVYIDIFYFFSDLHLFYTFSVETLRAFLMFLVAFLRSMHSKLYYFTSQCLPYFRKQKLHTKKRILGLAYQPCFSGMNFPWSWLQVVRTLAVNK